MQPSATMMDCTNATKLKNLRKVTRNDRTNCYGVEWREQGKRKYRYFKTADERDEFFRAHKSSETLEGFSQREWFRWCSLKSECQALDIQPEALLMYAKTVQRRSCERHTLSELINDYMDKGGVTKSKNARQGPPSEDYARHLRHTFKELEAAFGSNIEISEILPEALQEFLDGLEVGDITRKNWAMRIRQLFSLAVWKDWIVISPAVRLEYRNVIPPEPGILTPDQAAKLFESVSHDKELSAALALQAFLGMRAINVLRLSPEDISVKDRWVQIPQHKSKIKRSHILEHGIPENLWPWLERASIGEMCALTTRNYHWRKSNAYKSAGFVPPKNALRHSFATYKSALDGSTETARYLLGHETRDTIWRHYKSATYKANAEAYFSIIPTNRQVS